MKIIRGNSTLALLAHEMRLAWRGSSKLKNGKPDNRSRNRMIIFLVALGAIAGTVGVPFAMALNEVPAHPTPLIAAAADAGVLVLMSLMLSGTVAASAQTFFERGDLDLLLSSPTPPQRVLTVRCLGMALNVALYALLLASPVIIPAVVMGHPKWLSVYAVVGAVALFATSTGLAIATALFKAIGPRRAKTLAQVMSALIGAFIFIIAQVRNLVLINGRRGSALTDKVNAYTQVLMKFAHSDLFAGDQPAAWIARALMGEWKIALIMLGASALLFIVVVQLIGRRFAADAAAAAGVGAARPKSAKRGVSGFEGGPFRATMRKELRLLARDPALVSQVLLRVLYILPMGFAVWGVAHGVSKFQLTSASFLVFITSQLAGTMAWIMVSAEDALELIATAPVRAGMMRRAKLTAAMIPVTLIVAGPLAGLIYVSPLAGAETAVGCFCAAISACLIAVWYEKPARRQDLRRRRSGSLVGAIAEFLVGVCWSAAVGAAMVVPWWTPIPVVVALVILIAIRRPERSFAEVLQSQ